MVALIVVSVILGLLSIRKIYKAVTTVIKTIKVEKKNGKGDKDMKKEIVKVIGSELADISSNILYGTMGNYLPWLATSAIAQ
ncbi:hypothetical protein SM907_21645 [Klebsiella aerogenes]|uniref:hypothetical protein n=1 Tax=Klebsiella aerogenes TaxID=548 RepID=UPI002A7F7887|nr:hypothetical protein [Klebsiella aerogenes]WPS07929.1 hypothetical protein SM907_21645 [Klebsiella aerogenes]